MSSERAVLRLITSSNSVGRSIAKSPGREVAALDKAEFAQALAEPGGRVRVRPCRRGAEREHADPGHGTGRLRPQQGDTARQTTGGDELEQAAAVHSISLFARSIRGRAVVVWAPIQRERRDGEAGSPLAQPVHRLLPSCKKRVGARPPSLRRPGFFASRPNGGEERWHARSPACVCPTAQWFGTVQAAPIRRNADRKAGQHAHPARLAAPSAVASPPDRRRTRDRDRTADHPRNRS